MSMSRISETDFHAYVDGQLDAARRAEVEAYLAAYPDAAAEVQDLRAQNHLLHAAYDRVLNESVPMQLSNALQQRRSRYGIAAVVAWLGCGLILGWFLRGPMEQGGTAAMPAFARQALAAHVLYVAEKRHPVEVAADQEAHLVAWLSKRLDAPIRAPQLRQQGFELLGGRLLPGTGGAPLAQLMYQSAQGARLTLTVRHVADARETGFRVLNQGGTSVFYWIDRDYGYALSGSIDRQRLLSVAHAVESQLRY
jgi:anti-sigma factor RsiW